MSANGHLMDIPSKGRLYKTSDGAWRKYQTHAKIIEWGFYPSPFRIVNYGVTTGRANILQVTVKESNDQEPTSYWFEIGRGDQCKFAKDPKVAAVFANIDKNSVVGVWHYKLAHWP